MKTIHYIFIAVSAIVTISIIIVIVVVATKNGKEETKTPNKGDKEESKEEEEIEDICSNKYSDECLYEKMIAKKGQYPEGMKWTNDNRYCWKGGIYSCGNGCAGFAFMLSDACFDDLKALNMNPCPGNFKVGDVVRINKNTHSVIILKIDKSTNTITIAEGNFNSSIHWGRTFTISQLEGNCDYILRRNPN